MLINNIFEIYIDFMFYLKIFEFFSYKFFSNNKIIASGVKYMIFKKKISLINHQIERIFNRKQYLIFRKKLFIEKSPN